MKNKNDHPLFPRTSFHLYVLFHITRVKTIQPLILCISSSQKHTLCPVALFPPSLTTVPVSGEISAGRGGGEGRNKIACPLLALVLRNRSCVAHADVFPWYQADAFRQDLQGDVKREYLEYRAGKGFADESSRETDRWWQRGRGGQR